MYMFKIFITILIIVAGIILKFIQFTLSKLGQFIHVDKTSFLRPGHVCLRN